MDINKLKGKLKELEIKLDKAIDSENYENAADIREKIDKLNEKIKNVDRKNDLEQQFEDIKEKHSDFKPDVFFAGEELPGLGENIEIYDYEGEFEKMRNKAAKVIEIMVLNIFNNDTSVLKDKVIIEKMNDDIDAYTDLKFASSMSRRLFMNGMKDLDNGGNASSRMYEVVSKMQAEMRQNNKMLNSMMKDINGSYRQLKEDMSERLISEEENEDTNIIDQKSMNETIQKHLEEKKKKRIEERRNTVKSQTAQEEEAFENLEIKDDNKDEKKGDN